jgi:cytidylate kinase
MAIVTVSRGSKCGGKALAELVAREVGLPCVGREVLVEAAAKLRVPEWLLAEKMEQAPGLWERMALERRVYIAAVQTALADCAMHGRLVYHGMAGHLLLRGVPAVLRVRLIAPIETRVRAVMDERGVTRDEAASYIHRIDEQRVRWTKLMYGVSLLDSDLYDVIINLEVVTVESAAAVVVAALRRPEFEITEVVAAQLVDFALACRVRAALAGDLATRGLELEVGAVHGRVRVSGDVPATGMIAPASSRCEADVKRVVAAVPGVERAEFDLLATSTFAQV